MMKQSQAFLCIRWLSFTGSSCSGSWPLTMETAIFVKSHVKSHLRTGRLADGLIPADRRPGRDSGPGEQPLTERHQLRSLSADSLSALTV